MVLIGGWPIALRIVRDAAGRLPISTTPVRNALLQRASPFRTVRDGLVQPLIAPGTLGDAA